MASVASRPRALPRLGSLPNNWVLPTLVLLGLLLVSAYLRTDSLGASLWMDEGLSIGIASQPLLDIPGTLQVDGSPPLYYMLLSVWMNAFGDGPADTQALSVAISLHRRPGRPVGRLEPVRPARRALLRRALRGQPVPHGVRPGDAHVLAHARHVAARHRGLPARVRVRAQALPAGLHGAARGDALHAQLGTFPRRRARPRADPLLVRVRGAVEPREGRADRVRRRRAPVSPVGPHAAASGAAHGCAVAEPAELRRTRSDHPLAPRRRHAHGGARPGRRLRHRRHPRAARRRQGADRAPVRRGDRARDAGRRVDRVAGLARLDHALPRRAARPDAAARRPRARARRDARHGRARDHRRDLGDPEELRAREQVERLRSAQRRGAGAAQGRPRGLHAAGAGAAARVPPRAARRGARSALRQPDGAGEERHDHGLDRRLRQAQGRHSIGESRPADC